MEVFLFIKLVHILSATLLFGTGLGTAFFMWQSHRSGDRQSIAKVAKHVVLADWCFTAPAVVIQPLTGFWMMHIRGYSITDSWITMALILFIVSGLCWIPVVWIQYRIRDLAYAAVSSREVLSPTYFKYMRIWFALGWPAFIAVILSFYLMVFKPALW